MLARCTTYVLDGVTAHPVTVECDIRPGLPTFTVLGLSDAASRDLRETVRAAIQNSGYPFPERRVTLNIAPAWLRRSAPSVSLAVAVALLAASGEIPADQVAAVAVYGALTLGGEIAPLPGTLAAAAAHRSSGCAGPLLYAGPALPPDLAAAGSLPRRASHPAAVPQVLLAGPAAARPAGPRRVARGLRGRSRSRRRGLRLDGRRRRRTPRPVARRPGLGRDDARASSGDDPARAHRAAAAGGRDDPRRGRPRSRAGPSVPRAASHDQRRRARWRRFATAAG